MKNYKGQFILELFFDVFNLLKKCSEWSIQSIGNIIIESNYQFQN